MPIFLPKTLFTHTEPRCPSKTTQLSYYWSFLPRNPLKLCSCAPSRQGASGPSELCRVIRHCHLLVKTPNLVLAVLPQQFTLGFVFNPHIHCQPGLERCSRPSLHHIYLIKHRIRELTASTALWAHLNTTPSSESRCILSIEGHKLWILNLIILST